MMGTVRRHFLAPLLVIAALSCVKEEPHTQGRSTTHALPSIEHDSSKSDTDTAPERTAVQFMFRPAPSEKRHIDSMLDKVQGQFLPSNIQLLGQLWRFGDSSRYVLVSTLAAPSAVNPDIRFVVLERERISEPSPWSIPERLDNFEVAFVKDIDADSLPDLGYCYWPSRNQDGHLTAAGYRDRWYRILAVDTSLARCRRSDVEP